MSLAVRARRVLLPDGERAVTVHTGGDERPVATGEDAVRLPLSGGWTATAWGTELHRVAGAVAGLTAPERETA